MEIRIVFCCYIMISWWNNVIRLTICSWKLYWHWGKYEWSNSWRYGQNWPEQLQKHKKIAYRVDNSWHEPHTVITIVPILPSRLAPLFAVTHHWHRKNFQCVYSILTNQLGITYRSLDGHYLSPRQPLKRMVFVLHIIGTNHCCHQQSAPTVNNSFL